MLNFFRKAQIPQIAFIVVMLLLSVQQNFARTTSTIISYENKLTSNIIVNNSINNHGWVVDNQNDLYFDTSVEQLNSEFECCSDDGCDSSCPNVVSFTALIPNNGSENTFEQHNPILYFELRNNLVLPSGLFRPPRTNLS